MQHQGFSSSLCLCPLRPVQTNWLTHPVSDSPLALRAAAYIVLPGEEWDKSCIQQGDRRSVSLSVLKTDTHTHAYTNTHSPV